MINFDLKDYGSIDVEELNKYLGEYSGYTGWMNLDNLKEGLPDIKEIVRYIKKNSEVLLVVGVGGSYMSSKAVITALSPYFDNNFEIYYLGYQMSDDYYNELIKIIKDKDICINFISKSGDTLEIKVFYKLLLEFMKGKYSDSEIKERVIITTSSNDGYLYNEVKENDYKFIKHPDDIGGRYTLFTPVHTLPMLVADIDVDKMFEGAIASMSSLDNQIKYAVFRNEMFNKGVFVEAYVVYEEKLGFLVEWIKQLYAESLGKNERGVLPIKIINTRDLHSLEQFLQEGNKIVFETNINIKSNNKLGSINDKIYNSIRKAHGNIPNVSVNFDELNEYNLGYFMQFMMYSCAISGYVENVNPFNQEGVERYKSELKQLIS